MMDDEEIIGQTHTTPWWDTEFNVSLGHLRDL